MKVSLEMLRDDLEELRLRGHIDDDPWVARCSHAVACTRPIGEFRDDAVYVTEPSMLPRHVPPSFGTPSIVCLGKPSEEWLMAPCNILYTEEDVDVSDVFNLVAEDIAGYQEWEDDLMAVVDGGGSEEDFMVCVRRCIGNPFFINGSEFQVLLCSIPDEPEDSLPLESYREEYGSYGDEPFSPEDINFYLSDEAYHRSLDSTEPCLYDSSRSDCRTILYNIRLGGTTVGRLIIDEVVEPFKSRDFVLAKVIGGHLAKEIGRDRGYGFSRMAMLDPILEGLLSHTLLPEGQIRLLLDELGWDMYDGYACLVLRPRMGEGVDPSSLRPLAMGMAQELSLDCYIVFEGSIACVCNLTRMDKTGEQVLSDALPYIRDNSLMASISSEYGDFKDLYYYYQQACAAIDIGLQRDPMRWTFRFEDYEMDFMVGKVMERTTTGMLVPKGLKALIEHDGEKGGSYVETLRAYLENDRSIADASRLLHIHRSTFAYRMEKIEEILGMDLDDPDTRMVLRMAFRILDASSRGHGEGSGA